MALARTASVGTQGSLYAAPDDTVYGCDSAAHRVRTGPHRLPRPDPSVSTIYRVLVRHGLVKAVPRQAAPAGLQALAAGGADGAVAAGHRRRHRAGRRIRDQDCHRVDDHSRFCVIGTVVRRATGRPVCAGQQFWLGPDRAGTAITLWADTTVVHLLVNGARLKTVLSRLTTAQLRQLLVDGG